MKRFFCNTFFLFLLAFQPILAQQANMWYFGNGAGVDFTYGHPQALLNGELYTNEGSAVACDEKGKLLFYTDGTTIWNHAHDTMEDGIDLAGGKSATQSAVIVRKPYTPSIYYVFTVAEQIGAAGLSYSIVDMAINNGKGKVIEKNKLLLTPTTEKLTTVKHANGIDSWVITHQWNNNKFCCYLVNAFGISEPVVSEVGQIHKNYGSLDNGESIGYLKASPDGTKLACVLDKKKTDNIELFDFNAFTGKITNSITLSAKGDAYGVSFSPDNSKLYISFEAGPTGVIQYDLNANTIPKSGVAVSINNNIRHGALQLGPDGKLYIATATPFLDAIQNPNAVGVDCKYRANAVNLMLRYSTYGLPAFTENIFNNANLNLGRDTTICAEYYELSSNIKAQQYLWSTGATTKEIRINQSNTYWLKTTSGNAVQADTIRVILNKKSKLVVSLGNDTVLCQPPYLLDAKNTGAMYLWSTGATSQTIEVKESSKYWVKVTEGVCTKTDTVEIKFRGKPVFIPLPEFSPNNGGFNETFDYMIDNIDDFYLKIVNSKKKAVFSTKDPAVKWDGMRKGKALPKGTYKWTLKYKSRCLGNKTYTQTGEVKLLKFK